MLEALEKSRLTLSANSTSLARWDTRLGVQDLPFVSKLAHLSRDGGPAALMDVIIERLFPIAYVYSGKDKKTPPWGEEEEISLQEAWKVCTASQRRASADILGQIRCRILSLTRGDERAGGKGGGPGKYTSLSRRGPPSCRERSVQPKSLSQRS